MRDALDAYGGVARTMQRSCISPDGMSRAAPERTYSGVVRLVVEAYRLRLQFGRESLACPPAVDLEPPDSGYCES